MLSMKRIMGFVKRQDDGIRSRRQAARNSSILAMLSPCLRISVVYVVLVSLAYAAEPGSPETFASGTAQWVRHVPLNSMTLPMSNPGGYLLVQFGSQGMSYPEVNIVRAESGSSEGGFTGDYLAAGITNVNFRLYCPTHRPKNLRLYIYCASSGRWWYYPLSDPTVGAWTDYAVTLDYATGWKHGSGGSFKEISADLANVTWIGIQLQRNDSTDAQQYGIDDFAAFGVVKWLDTDGDGVSDWREFIAGTDKRNAKSRFEMGIGKKKAPEGGGSGADGSGIPEGAMVLRWTSSPGRTYAILRSTDQLKTFTPLITNIVATPPANEYVDESATGEGPYFYKVGVE